MHMQVSPRITTTSTTDCSKTTRETLNRPSTNEPFRLQTQQRECAGSSQGPLDVSNHSNSNHSGTGFPSKSSAFASSLGHGSHDDDDSEASHIDEDQKPIKQTKSISTNVAPGSKLCDPLYDEDIIDGFAILSFATYEDLEVVLINQHIL